MMDAAFDTSHSQEILLEPAPALTVAMVRKLIRGWTDLTANRRQKMMTALSTATRALVPMQTIDVAEAQLSFSCPSLRSLRGAPPAMFGLSTGRITSLVSELRYVLTRLGLHEPSRRKAPLVDPGLRAHHEALPTGRQLALVDYFRFLDANGIKPEAAGRDVLEAYVSTFRERTLCRDPERRGKQVSDAWNWARQHVQGWPPLSLPAPAEKEVLAMRLAALPESFQEDVRHYLARLKGQDLGDWDWD